MTGTVRYVPVGIHYCLTHDGVRNRDDSSCNSAAGESRCDFRELFRREAAEASEAQCLRPASGDRCFLPAGHDGECLGLGA